jgi:hypothetical protein
VTASELLPLECECILIQGVEIVFLRKEAHGVGGLKKGAGRDVDYEGRKQGWGMQAFVSE